MAKKRGTKRKAGTQGTSQKRQQQAPRKSGGRRWSIIVIGAVLLLVAAYPFAIRWRTSERIKRITFEVERAARNGQWTRVQELAVEWSSLEPAEYLPLSYAAEAAFNRNEIEAAVEFLSRIPDGSPVEAYQQLGFLQMEALNDPLGTKATCDRTLRFYPDDTETHQRLLFFFSMTGQRRATADEARRALEIGAESLATFAYLVAHESLTFTNGYDINQRWLEAEPGLELFEVGAVLQLPSYPGLRELARASLELDMEPRPNEFVARKIQQLREDYPNNLELLAAETRNLCREGDATQVATNLAMALPGMEKDHRFWRYKGWYHATNEQWGEAVSAYNQALAIEPLDWSTRLELAAALRATEGIAAAAAMQELADLGKRVVFAVQDSPQLHQLEPALYKEMEAYFEACGQNELVAKLVYHVREAGLQ